VIKNLKVSSLKELATAVLLNAGESVFPTLEAAYAEESQSFDVLRQIIHIYGKIKSREAVTLLLAKLDDPDRKLLNKILESLRLCDYQATETQEKTAIEQLLHNEFTYGVQVLDAQSLLEGVQKDFLLAAALDGEMKKIRTRIFLLLSFIYPSEVIMKIQSNFNADQADKRDLAIELLDTTVNTAHKTLIKVLLKVGSRKIRHNSNSSPELFECLQNMIFQPWLWNNPWIRVCAIDCAVTLVPLDLHETFASLLNDHEDLIQETVRYILDLSSATPILEKVKILRTISFFSEIPDEILAEVAAFLKDILIDEGKRVIHKGECGTSMYIVADGALRVHDEDEPLTEIGQGELFGEVAALLSEPRTASVTALRKSHLFQLSQEDLQTVMSSYIEVARGIIYFLYNSMRSFPRQRKNQQNPTPSPDQESFRQRYEYPLSRIEKVIILKTVSIFSNTPDTILSVVADLTQEVFLEKDSMLFKKGDIDTSMYIIVEGRVRVFNENRLNVELGEREPLGELTALFSEPQTVSVTALEDTRLLSLTQSSLFALMVDQQEIVQGIIYGLVQRLRNLRR
jgi:CRP-like cAMP-binding protein